ncbi:MAG: Hsp20/alpha crystallin family protein [Polyangiaceae bacterium]
MQQIVHDVEERLLGRFHRTTRTDPYQWLFEQTQWVPNLDVFTRGNCIVVRTALPGLSSSDVKVELEDGVLCISGRSAASAAENVRLDSNPYSDGFIRRLTLPDGVTEEDLDVSFADDVLEIAFDAESSSEQERAGSTEEEFLPHA